MGHDVVIGRYAIVGGGALLSGCARIGEGTMVGAGAFVLYNTAVGDWATVGIGAAVYAPVENGITALGNPARALPGANHPLSCGITSSDSQTPDEVACLNACGIHLSR